MLNEILSFILFINHQFKGHELKFKILQYGIIFGAWWLMLGLIMPICKLAVQLYNPKTQANSITYNREKIFIGMLKAPFFSICGCTSPEKLPTDRELLCLCQNFKVSAPTRFITATNGKIESSQVEVWDIQKQLIGKYPWTMWNLLILLGFCNYIMSHHHN